MPGSRLELEERRQLQARLKTTTGWVTLARTSRRMLCFNSFSFGHEWGRCRRQLVCRMWLRGAGRTMANSQRDRHMLPGSWGSRCRQRRHSPGDPEHPFGAVSSLGSFSKTDVGLQTDLLVEDCPIKTHARSVAKPTSPFITCCWIVCLQDKSGIGWAGSWAGRHTSRSWTKI